MSDRLDLSVLDPTKVYYHSTVDFSLIEWMIWYDKGKWIAKSPEARNEVLISPTANLMGEGPPQPNVCVINHTKLIRNWINGLK